MQISNKVKTKEELKLSFLLIKKLLAQGSLKLAKLNLEELLSNLEMTNLNLFLFKKNVLKLAKLLGIKIKQKTVLAFANRPKKELKLALKEMDFTNEDLSDFLIVDETNSSSNSTKTKTKITNIIYDLNELKKQYSKSVYNPNTQKSLSYEILSQYGILGLINDKQPKSGLEKIIPKAGDKLNIAFVSPEEYYKIQEELKSHKFGDLQNKNKYTSSTLQQVVKQNETLEGILVAVNGYKVKAKDLNDSSKSYKVLAENSETGKIEEHYIQNNSVLAILDKSLKAEGKTATYEMQTYTDSDTGKKETGLLLTGVEEFEAQAQTEFGDTKNTGVLGFVNKEEPEAGTIPIDNLVPKEGDTLSLAYVLQGTYKGNFGECESCVPLEKME